MSDTTNNVTVESILKNEAVAYEAQKLSAYASNAMRPAIIRKSIEGRTKAIDADFAAECGVSKERLDDWKYNIDTLYECAVAYSDAIGTDAESRRKDELYRVWKTIIRVGEADTFHPNMYIREKDVDNLRVLAAESTHEHVKGVGFVATVRGKQQFRGFIEIRLALRIAGNATLNDADRDTVQGYKKAVKVIKQTRDLLMGYTDSQGKVVPSLYDIIDDAEASLKEAESSKKDKLIKHHTAIVTNLHNQLEAAEKRLAKYMAVEKELRENYQKIVERLDRLEGAVEEKPTAKPRTKAEIREELRKSLEEFGENAIDA